MSSKLAEAKALREANKAKKAADKEAKEAARAERTAARQERSEARAERAEERQANTLKADATIEEIVDILRSPTEGDVLKGRAFSRLSLNGNLYSANPAVVHKHLGDIIANGGRNLDSLLNQVSAQHPEALVPHIDKLTARLLDPPVHQTSTGAPPALMFLQNVASAAPDKVFPHVSTIYKNCNTAQGPKCRSVLAKLIGRAARAKSPKDAADQMFLLLVGMLKAPDAKADPTLPSTALVEISNMREKVTNSMFNKLLLNNMPALAAHKEANLEVFTAIDDFANGRSMKVVSSRLDGQDARLAMHEKWLKEHDERLTSLADQFELSKDQMKGMTEELNKIAAGNEEQTTKMLGMIEGITKCMKEGKQQGMGADGGGEGADELEQLLASDMYLRALYNTVRSELTATYLASKSVQTDIVANSKSGAAGDVGSVLQTASSYIPVIGAGVMFLGAVLSLVDASTQATMVQRFANLAADTDDMNRISRAVAKQLVLCVDRDKVNRPESMAEKCKGWIKFGMSTLAGNMDGDAGSAAAELASIGTNFAMGAAQEQAADAVTSFDFKGMFSRKPKQAPTAQQTREAEEAAAAEMGEADAGIVANAVISAVYSGKAPGKHRPVPEKVDFLTAFVQNEFGRGTTPAAAAAPAPASGTSLHVNPMSVGGEGGAGDAAASPRGPSTVPSSAAAKGGCCTIS